jgi:uncharacterized protein YbcI
MEAVLHVEAAVKRVISAQYKELFGKGPEETTVHIADNMMTIKFSGIMTRIEETLCKAEEGNRLVKEIRERIINVARLQYLPSLEEICDRKIEHMTYYYSESTNNMYLFIIFEQDH